MKRIKLFLYFLSLVIAFGILYAETEQASSQHQAQACSMAKARAQSAASATYCNAQRGGRRVFDNCDCWQDQQTRMWTCAVNWRDVCN